MPLLVVIGAMTIRVGALSAAAKRTLREADQLRVAGKQVTSRHP
jgi:hypothetical protein